MLLLLAALLATGDAGAEFSLSAGAGLHGERRGEAVAQASSEDLSLTLGATDFAGRQAPERQEILLGAKAGVVQGEVRAVPPSSGLSRLSGEVGVHFETVGLVLGGRIASLGRTALRAASARLELERQLTDELRGGLSASAWVLQLDSRARNPWASWGNSTLDWAQRWETGAWLSRDLDRWSLTPSISASQSAQPGVYEARASLAVELSLGSFKLRAEPALARQFPELWLFDVTAGVTLALR